MTQTVKDEIGTEVLYENDQIKIWNMQLEPGQGQGMHRHRNDYVLVFIGDCRLRGVNQDGSTRFEETMTDGTTILRTIDGDEDIHDAINVGDSVSRNPIIELKKR